MTESYIRTYPPKSKVHLVEPKLWTHFSFKKVEEPGNLLDRDWDDKEKQDGPLYAVHNYTLCDPNEEPVMYVQRILFKGYGKNGGDHREWLVWFAGTGKMYSGCGKTRIEAVSNAIKSQAELAIRNGSLFGNQPV